MKTKQIISSRRLLPFFMAAALTITLGCTKDDGDSMIPGINHSSPVQPGDNLKVSFVVQPTGTIVTAFEGAVELNFPSGAVYYPTEFTLVSCCTDNMNLNGIRIFNKGFSLEMEDGAVDLFLHEHVEVHLKYDLTEESWLKSVPENEENLTIYKSYPNLEVCNNVQSIGDCCTDNESNIVMGCIDQCGFYVVGEN